MRKPTSDEQFGSYEDGDLPEVDVIAEDLGTDGYEVYDPTEHPDYPGWIIEED